MYMLYICIIPNRGGRIGHQTYEHFLLVNYCRKFGFQFVFHDFTAHSKDTGAALNFDKIHKHKFTDPFIQSMKRITLSDIPSINHNVLVDIHNRNEDTLFFEQICGHEYLLGTLQYKPTSLETDLLRTEYSEFYKNFYPRKVEGSYICIHIRRGDIINMPSRFLNTMYFIDKYNYLLTKISEKDLPVYAITEDNFDDDALLKTHIPSVNIIRCSPVDAFYYLVNCNYLVASCSGFSNLAHFLGDMKIVVPPKWGFMEHNRI